MVIADMGSVRPGVPTLTVGLRGMAAVIVEVRTLAGPKHSGQFGGAGPDALIALLHALATLHDEDGDVAVRACGASRGPGASYSDEEFRDLAEVEPGIPFFGTGGLGERLWSGPAATVTGIDALPVDGAVNAVVPYARAKVSHPHPPGAGPGRGAGGADPPLRGPAAVRGRADRDARPRPARASSPRPTGPAYEAARTALADRVGRRDGRRSRPAARSRS